MLDVMLCLGTRPEIIKMAPVYRALKQRGVKARVLHTGQHDTMADPIYSFFQVEPDIRLTLPRTKCTLSHLGAVLLDKVGDVLAQEPPDLLMVHGDTSTAAMAALAGFYQHVPVAHVEAGLRSGDPENPFPEEKNREIVARLASLHFCPTQQAARNLRLEGVREGVFVTGNTVVDAVRLGKQALGRLNLKSPFAEGARKVLVTAHRRENLGEAMANVARAVAELLVRHPDVSVLWPLHANKAVRDVVQPILSALPASAASRLRATEPLGYPELLSALSEAWIVLTDSGGIQEEATSFGTPVLILRETTERPEVVEAGGGTLVGTNPDAILREIARLHDNPGQYRRMRLTSNPFGDGHAAERIASIVLSRMGGASDCVNGRKACCG